MKKALLIINNITGNGHNATVAFQVISAIASCGYQVTAVPIEQGLKTDLMEYLSTDRYDLLVCMGGDGTLNKTVSGMLSEGQDIPIAYIPGGTTCDFARTLGISRDLNTALEMIRKDHRETFDTGNFNDRHFLYVASFGAFASVSYDTDQGTKNLLGYAAYALRVMETVSDNISMRCHIRFETDQEAWEDDYIFGAICNSTSVAGFKLDNITSEDLHDGQFELILVKAPDRDSNLMAIAGSILIDKLSSPFVRQQKVRSLKMYTDDNTVWTLDGEFGGNFPEIDFSVRAGGITLLVP